MRLEITEVVFTISNGIATVTRKLILVSVTTDCRSHPVPSLLASLPAAGVCGV